MERSTTAHLVDGLERFDSFAFDDVRTAFMHNVSRGLRTPLTVLMGYAELLNTGELGTLAPEQREAMFIIMDRAQELQTLVNQIGTILAIQTGEFLKQPVALPDLVAQIIAAQREKVTTAHITLEFEIAPDVPEIAGDVQLLSQAIDCLIENSLKHTPNAGRVEVSVATEPDGVTLTVTNTGTGMAADASEKLCRPFQRINHDATRHYDEMDLGLTLVYNVVTAQRGTIEVETEAGRGSQITLRFPIRPVIEVQTSDTPASNDTKRILVVDDEEFVAFTLQEGLDKLPNCEVSVTMSGQDALERFERCPFDLLITDYKMPDMDGVTLAKRVRQRYPRTGIIMVTAYGHDLVHDATATDTIQHFLNKPIRLSEIRSIALETLQGDQATSVAGAGAADATPARRS